MRKLYEKKEILFAVLWIVAYCVILGTIRGNFGDESIYMLLALLVFTAGIIAFVKANHLEGKYGLAGWPKDMKKYLFFIPMWILATGNIWDGFAPSYHGSELAIASLSAAVIIACWLVAPICCIHWLTVKYAPCRSISCQGLAKSSLIG